ncbi:hypothetical protein EDC56_2082 [Sinobacterium caligoides]|uniref:DnaT DNA-binding domain-containing protein n=1 Tax=Sinobacterium caligoides TaxID=933926 RepID=A0A3N2DP93_9GAMM|nr:DnaT-like ssDNA-binding domain-containing protein [Sinobacterium caligoides]ROS01638.1 hypothetical protein EDC56_2082 [Sinobacterium caligoides]
MNMPLSLVQQRNIVIPSRLAEQIGLECAVLLQALSDYALHAENPEQGGFRWLQLPKSKLLALLPFWTENDIQRISDQLRDAGLIRLDSPQLALTDHYRFALNQSSTPSKNRSTSTRSTISRNLPNFTPRKRQLTPNATSPPPMRDSHNAVRDTQTSTGESEHRYSAQQRNNNSGVNNLQQRTIAPSWPTLGAKNNGQLIPSDWRPSESKIQQLSVIHGVPVEFCQQQVGEFVTYWLDAAERHVSWESKFHRHIVKEWQYQQVRNNQQQLKKQNKQERQTAAAADLNDWQPNAEAVEIMLRDGVDHDFIFNAVPEFILYWRERDSGAGQWNTKFLQHIRITWARYSATIDNDSLPQLMPGNWSPSADALDVLRMANIDLTFAESLIGEFVIFWRDSQQPQRSWNSKFIQHVKHHWARRHQLEAKNVGSQGHQNFTGKDQRSLVEKHTDSSWADDL